MSSSQPKLAAQDVLERPAEGATTVNGGRVQTTAEIRRALEARQDQRRQEFLQKLDKFDAKTKRELSEAANPTKQAYGDAAARYVKMLGQFHGRRRSAYDGLFCRIRHRWMGAPIVEVMERTGPNGADLSLVAEVWIHPEGVCWEAREAKTVDDEGLDEEHRLVFYKFLEPYKKK